MLPSSAVVEQYDNGRLSSKWPPILQMKLLLSRALLGMALRTRNPSIVNVEIEIGFYSRIMIAMSRE